MSLDDFNFGGADLTTQADTIVNAAETAKAFGETTKNEGLQETQLGHLEEHEVTQLTTQAMQNLDAGSMHLNTNGEKIKSVVTPLLQTLDEQFKFAEKFDEQEHPTDNLQKRPNSLNSADQFASTGQLTEGSTPFESPNLNEPNSSNSAEKLKQFAAEPNPVEGLNNHEPMAPSLQPLSPAEILQMANQGSQITSVELEKIKNLRKNVKDENTSVTAQQGTVRTEQTLSVARQKEIAEIQEHILVPLPGRKDGEILFFKYDHSNLEHQQAHREKRVILEVDGKYALSKELHEKLGKCRIKMVNKEGVESEFDKNLLRNFTSEEEEVMASLHRDFDAYCQLTPPATIKPRNANPTKEEDLEKAPLPPSRATPAKSADIEIIEPIKEKPKPKKWLGYV